MKSTRYNRALAAVVAAVYVVAILFSAAVILSHAGHIHDHHGAGGACQTCVHITAAGNLLKTVGTAAMVAAAAVGLRFGVVLLARRAPKQAVLSGLVGLKVRLNN
jgi:hypothetical protein